MSIILKNNIHNIPINYDYSLKKAPTKNGKAWTTTIYDHEGKLWIPPFNDIPISTMTIIAHTNLIINTDKFFKYMPITDYTIVRKKRGRKKKIITEDPNRFIPPGSIISLTKRRLVRGVVLKAKKKKSKTFFRHSVSTVMLLDSQKMINVKVSRSGKLQMTGAKSLSHAMEFIKHIYSLMIETEEWTGETLFTYKDGSNDNFDDDNDDEKEIDESIDPQDAPETQPELDRESNNGLNVVFQIAMLNMDFTVGYRIRRDKLNMFINRYTEFRSIFESSIGNSSVNIKLKADKCVNRSLKRLRITSRGELIEDSIPYDEFFGSLTEKERKTIAKKSKEAVHTFLAFASGSVIFSSCGDEMSSVFYKFLKILIENRQHIEEISNNIKIDTSWIDK